MKNVVHVKVEVRLKKKAFGDEGNCLGRKNLNVNTQNLGVNEYERMGRIERANCIPSHRRSEGVEKVGQTQGYHIWAVFDGPCPMGHVRWAMVRRTMMMMITMTIIVIMIIMIMDDNDYDYDNYHDYDDIDYDDDDNDAHDNDDDDDYDDGKDEGGNKLETKAQPKPKKLLSKSFFTVQNSRIYGHS